MTTNEQTREGDGSVELKAGRLLNIGLPSTKLDRHARAMLRDVQPGGVILFKRNIETAAQVALLTAQIRDAVGRKVFISIDQEGGLVDRFRHICEPMPSARSVRDAGSSELAQRHGELSARLLRLLGINMNFAPVLDLGGDNEDNGLRARTFGPNPRQVSRLAGAYLDGLQRGGVVGCGKHFPGLGGSKVDSHRRLPVIKHTWEEIVERDLQPFMDLMFTRPGERLHSVMVSHAAFPDVSEFLHELFRRTRELPSPEEMHQLPATISGNVVMRLLRQVLKFDGLVITDDMEMGAVVQTLTVPEACVRAVEAGSDMVLICEQEANYRASRDRLCEAVSEGRITTGHLERAGRRVETALAAAADYEPFGEDELQKISRDIAQLKLDLKSAETTGEYTPLFGTEEGDLRRSSNF
ncbi:MAG TPA: glycoside hydrolase family 3 N-terminal domain-containing protein [Pyrinomonadaceae bacterium]|nr:glycoside hydrolase family 3 N-terminal domain-containing protein [Pyrinomonadaceae bacterium]